VTVWIVTMRLGEFRTKVGRRERSVTGIVEAVLVVVVCCLFG
jgi:hypothetical protein